MFNPFPTYLLFKVKIPNHAHSNLNKFSNFEKYMKTYFQLKIPKYLEATYTINQEHIVKTMRKLKRIFPMAFRDPIAYLVIKI